MNTGQAQSITASRQNLVRLCIIRCIALSGQWMALAYAYTSASIDLNYHLVITVLCFLSIITIATFIRIKKPWPVIELEFFAHLLIDIFGLSLLLYYSGGATNPFISYYLIPISISAAVLPWVYTWSITGLCIIFYSIMLYYYIPLPLLEPHLGHTTTDSLFSNFHIMGMWLNFTVSAALITFFVVKMAKALRQQEHTILVNQEQNHKNAQLISVATLAAGTAHELGTPLSTMAVLLTEIENENADNQALIDDIELLKQQVASCRKILQNLSNTADSSQTDTYKKLDIKTYLQDLIERWNIMRPDIQADLHFSCQSDIPSINTTPVLDQAITNLLNNAADANINNKTSINKIEIGVEWDGKTIGISIKDFGAGISADVMENIGKPFISSKGKGLGLGLFLTHTTITRLGGSIRLYNHDYGGTLAEINLPHSTI